MEHWGNGWMVALDRWGFYLWIGRVGIIVKPTRHLLFSERYRIRCVVLPAFGIALVLRLRAPGEGGSNRYSARA